MCWVKEVDRKRKKYIYDMRKAEGRELIDTLWNVKLSSLTVKEPVLIELIDTLWNVKQADRTFAFLASMELIDTLWNIKSFVLIVTAHTEIN